MADTPRRRSRRRFGARLRAAYMLQDGYEVARFWEGCRHELAAGALFRHMPCSCRRCDEGRSSIAGSLLYGVERRSRYLNRREIALARSLAPSTCVVVTGSVPQPPLSPIAARAPSFNKSLQLPKDVAGLLLHSPCLDKTCFSWLVSERCIKTCKCALDSSRKKTCGAASSQGSPRHRFSRGS